MNFMEETIQGGWQQKKRRDYRAHLYNANIFISSANYITSMPVTIVRNFPGNAQQARENTEFSVLNNYPIQEKCFSPVSQFKKVATSICPSTAQIHTHTDELRLIQKHIYRILHCSPLLAYMSPSSDIIAIATTGSHETNKAAS